MAAVRDLHSPAGTPRTRGSSRVPVRLPKAQRQLRIQGESKVTLTTFSKCGKNVADIQYTEHI